MGLGDGLGIREMGLGGLFVGLDLVLMFYDKNGPDWLSVITRTTFVIYQKFRGLVW